MKTEKRELTELELCQKNVLNFNEACLFSGLSKSHMYRLTSTRQVPHFKPFGKMVYFERVELEKWLLQNKIEVL